MGREARAIAISSLFLYFVPICISPCSLFFLAFFLCFFALFLSLFPCANTSDMLKYSCMSSTFSIAILNGTFFLRCVIRVKYSGTRFITLRFIIITLYLYIFFCATCRLLNEGKMFLKSTCLCFYNPHICIPSILMRCLLTIFLPICILEAVLAAAAQVRAAADAGVVTSLAPHPRLTLSIQMLPYNPPRSLPQHQPQWQL